MTDKINRKAKPILFSLPMLIALQEGWKTETRRINPQNNIRWRENDYLWVKEAFCHKDHNYASFTFHRAALSPHLHERYKWTSAMLMPIKYARFLLKVESVSLQHLQDITEQEARAEGIRQNPVTKLWLDYSSPDDPDFLVSYVLNTYQESFKSLWDYNHRKKNVQWSYDKNPLVEVIKFVVISTTYEQTQQIIKDLQLKGKRCE